MISKKSKFREEQIVRILKKEATGQKSQAEICRVHNMSQNTFYLWMRCYGSMEREDVKKLPELERENTQPKKLLTERDLEMDAIQTLLKKLLRRAQREKEARGLMALAVSVRLACFVWG